MTILTDTQLLDLIEKYNLEVAPPTALTVPPGTDRTGWRVFLPQPEGGCIRHSTLRGALLLAVPILTGRILGGPHAHSS